MTNTTNTEQVTNVKVVMAPVQRFTLRYQKSRGEIKDYVISPIIDEDKQRGTFTVYSFTSKGIRSFKIANVIDIN